MLPFSYLALAVHSENGRKSGLQEPRNRYMLPVPCEKGNRSRMVKICQRGFLQGLSQRHARVGDGPGPSARCKHQAHVFPVATGKRPGFFR